MQTWKSGAMLVLSKASPEKSCWHSQGVKEKSRGREGRCSPSLAEPASGGGSRERKERLEPEAAVGADASDRRAQTCFCVWRRRSRAWAPRAWALYPLSGCATEFRQTSTPGRKNRVSALWVLLTWSHLISIVEILDKTKKTIVEKWEECCCFRSCGCQGSGPQFCLFAVCSC